MKSRFTRIFTGITLLVLAVLACNAPAQSLPTATQLPPSELTLISLIETLTTQAQAAPMSTATPALYTSSTDISYVLPTATPFVPPTDTPALLQMDTAVPSPVNPQVSVSAETNCRTGPGINYKLVWQAEPGITYPLVGKHSPTGYWIILLPDGRQCWLWGQNATVAGDINSLPEYIPPAVGRIEGVLRKSSAPDAKGIDQARVDIGLGFSVYETGSDGKFVFEDVPAGEVNVTVTNSTFIVPSFKIFVNAGQLTSVVKIGYILYNASVPPRPTPTPTRRPCPNLLPNCLFLPTLGPIRPVLP